MTILLTAIVGLLVQAGASSLTLGSPAMTACQPGETPVSTWLWYFGALLMLELAVFATAATVRRCASNGLAHLLLVVAICG